MKGSERTYRIGLRCSEEEYEAYSEVAALFGVGLSELFRASVAIAWMKSKDEKGFLREFGKAIEAMKLSRKG